MIRKHHFSFVKTTVIGGLVFLVPVVVTVVILAEAFDLMLAVAQPLAGSIPVDTIGGVALINVFAVLALIVLCFVAGLVARSEFVRKAVEAFESKVLSRLPGYILIKGIFSGLSETAGKQLKPVVVTLDDADRVGLEIERLRDGRVVVSLPRAPNPFAGELLIVTAQRVRRLNRSMGWYVEYIEAFGQGTDAVLEPEGGEAGA